MPDQLNTTAPATEPRLQNRAPEPKGVLQKNLKILVYLGAALVLIVASILSSKGNPTAKAAAAAKGTPPQPFVQDTTDNNVQELHSQVQAEKSRQQQDAALAATTGTVTNRINPLTGAQTGQGVYGTNPNPDVRQLTPVQEQQMQIESKDRELAHSSLAVIGRSLGAWWHRILGRTGKSLHQTCRLLIQLLDQLLVVAVSLQ